MAHPMMKLNITVDTAKELKYEKGNSPTPFGNRFRDDDLDFLDEISSHYVFSIQPVRIRIPSGGAKYHPGQKHNGFSSFWTLG